MLNVSLALLMQISPQRRAQLGKISPHFSQVLMLEGTENGMKCNHEERIACALDMIYKYGESGQLLFGMQLTYFSILSEYAA